jgi:hypothetical protein
MSGLRFIASSRPTFDPAGMTLTFDVPFGAVKGDALLIVAAYLNADSCPVPGGWARAVHLVGAAVTLDAYVRQLEDNEPSSVVLALALATDDWQGQIIAFRGGNPSSLIEASAISSYAAVATPNAPAVNTQQAINLELCAWSTDGGNVPVPPAGFMVVDGYESALATDRSFGIGFAIANTTGALPVRGATGANPSTGSALSLVLRDRAPVLPFVLDDPVPGNIGLRAVAGDTNIALRFDEPATAVLNDEIGSLDVLNTDAGAVSFPLMVAAWTGRGRRFVPSAVPPSGLIAHDTDEGNTLQQRDITIRAIVALELVAAAGSTMTLIARGTNDGSPEEPYCYGLELQEQGRQPRLRSTSAGSGRTAPPRSTRSPLVRVLAPGRRSSSSLLTATRRVGGDRQRRPPLLRRGRELHCRARLGRRRHRRRHHGPHDGRRPQVRRRIWSTRSATARSTSCKVDALRAVRRGARAGALTGALTVHQPAGVAMFVGSHAASARPGHNEPRQQHRPTRQARRARRSRSAIAGDRGAARDVAADDRGRRLRRSRKWEKASAASRPKAARLARYTRRARVVAYLSRSNGFSRPQVQAALAELFDLDAGDIQIIEFSNTIHDSFNSISGQRWLVGPVGVVTPGSPSALLHADPGSDIRWEPTRAWCHLGCRFRCRRRCSIRRSTSPRTPRCRRTRWPACGPTTGARTTRCGSVRCTTARTIASVGAPSSATRSARSTTSTRRRFQETRCGSACSRSPSRAADPTIATTSSRGRPSARARR